MRAVSVIMTAIMFTTCVYAENTSLVTYRTIIDDNNVSVNVSVKEADLISDTDNSDLNVNVIRQYGDTRSVIYTGQLIGYDNGAWINVDFSNNDFIVIFDWENGSDESIHIVPAERHMNILPSEQASMPSQEAVEEVITSNRSTSQNSDIKCNVNLMYDDAYYERIMIKNKQLNIPIEITNTSGENKNIVCHIGEYDADGKLIGTLSSTNTSVESGQTFTANIKKVI